MIWSLFMSGSTIVLEHNFLLLLAFIKLCYIKLKL